jgi:outer membrane protein OmpA-like peptidoglycan-associated protein
LAEVIQEYFWVIFALFSLGNPLVFPAPLTHSYQHDLAPNTLCRGRSRATRLLWVGVLAFYCFFSVARAQRPGLTGISKEDSARAGALRLKLVKSVYLRQTNLVDPKDPYLKFPNLNTLEFFEDKKQLKRIQNAEKRKEYRSLDTLLQRYVNNFGIKNFSISADLELVWKLGQIKELLGDTAWASYFYGLAVKNHFRSYPKIKIHYDSLRSRYTNEYVELDYYYRIVAARLKIDTLKPPKGVLLPIGRKVNTRFPDYAPFMHPSNQVLLFTSRRGPLGPDALDFMQNEDLYYTEVDPRFRDWSYSVRFPDIINSRYNEGSACLDNEGVTLIFARCNAPDGMGNCDLYQAEYINGKWARVRNLGPNVNSDNWDSHPNLSPDGNHLFFASNRNGGFGRTDIYVSDRQTNGTWGKARNIGPTINTIEDEVTPFQHPIYNTLYFSSTGHLRNFGGFDIFKSRQLGERWEEPRNLGPLVNSRGDEYYFSIDHKADTLFYANARPENPRNFDIYSFPMPMGARPDAVYDLTGYLLDSASNRPLTGIIVALDMDKNVEVEPLYLNKAGSFSFKLINYRRYNLVIVGDRAIRVPSYVEMTTDTVYSMLADAINSNKPIVFESVQFEPNSNEVSTELAPKLNAIATFMRQYPYAKLVIRGHTDADGEENYNLALSQKRAENIRQYLLDLADLPPSTISAEGYGESLPIFPNDDDDHKAYNRRVEFEIEIPEAYKDKWKNRAPINLDRPILKLTSPGVVPIEETRRRARITTIPGTTTEPQNTSLVDTSSTSISVDEWGTGKLKKPIFTTNKPKRAPTSNKPSPTVEPDGRQAPVVNLGGAPQPKAEATSGVPSGISDEEIDLEIGFLDSDEPYEIEDISLEQLYLDDPSDLEPDINMVDPTLNGQPAPAPTPAPAIEEDE